MSKEFVATRLDAETHQALKALAQQQDRSVSYLLRKLAEEYVQAEQKKASGKRAA